MTILAQYEFTPGWAHATIGLPDGTTDAPLKIGSFVTHTTVLQKHASGKTRFAVLDAKVDGAGIFPITDDGVTSPSVLTPTWPDVRVEFNIGGAIYNAPLPAFTPNDTWIAGPQVREARSLVTPTSTGTRVAPGPTPIPSTGFGVQDHPEPKRRRRLKYAPHDIPPPDTRAGAPHPLLQVIFDVRSYANEGHRVDICVQNCRNIAAANQVSYTVTVFIAGAPVFTRTKTHRWGARWRKVFLTGGVVESIVTPDFAPFIAGGLLPRFLPSVVNPTYTITGPQWDILEFGTWLWDMPAPGGRGDIGCYPWWTAQYLVHKTRNLRDHLLQCGDLAGSWSGCFFEPDGTTLLHLDAHPNMWWDDRSPPPNGPANGYAGAGPRIQAPHCPSTTYVPYMVTGDRYYLDTCKVWANTLLLQTYTGAAHGFGSDTHVDSNRQGAVGLLAPYSNEPRGFGWGMREITDAAIALPDRDADKGYFIQRVNNNLNWLDAYCASSNDGGWLNAPFWEFDPGTLHVGYYALSPWQNNYLTWAVDHAALAGFSPTAKYRNRAVTSMVRLMTPNAPMTPEHGASSWYPRMGTFTNGLHQPFTTPAQYFNANYATPADSLDGTDPNIPRGPGSVTIVGNEYRIALILGVRDAIPGAQAALTWLEGYPGLMGEVSYRSGFAIAPFTTGTPDPSPVDPPDPTDPPDVTPPPIQPAVDSVVAQIVTADRIDPNHDDNIVEVAISPRVIPQESDLSIEMTSVPEHPVEGQRATLTIVVTNPGPADNSGITVSLTKKLGGAVSIVESDLSQGTVSAGTGWSVGALAVHAVATARIVAQF